MFQRNNSRCAAPAHSRRSSTQSVWPYPWSRSSAADAEAGAPICVMLGTLTGPSLGLSRFG